MKKDEVNNIWVDGRPVRRDLGTYVLVECPPVRRDQSNILRADGFPVRRNWGSTQDTATIKNLQ